MEVFVVSFGVLVMVVAAMAIGVMFGRTPIAGSCGGLNVVGGKCGSCSRPCASRRGKQRSRTTAHGAG